MYRKCFQMNLLAGVKYQKLQVLPLSLHPNKAGLNLLVWLNQVMEEEVIHGVAQEQGIIGVVAAVVLVQLLPAFLLSKKMKLLQ